VTRALPIARDGAGVDLEAARRAAADFLSALGVAIDQEDLRDTPARMTRAYAELFDARPLRLTTFANDEGYDELVLARAIPFRTVCEHHLLPFSGVAHVGYLPGERIVGLSKLARLVEHFSARPQVQERLTKQVAERLATRLRAPRGRGAGSRALLHDAARRPGTWREDRHVGPAGHAAGRPAQPGGVLRAGWRTALNTSCPLGQKGSRYG
jgi:GTP cyclohydrolase I